jgi:hypothetical protein
VVEGTPLLRVHPGKTWIQGSNPCVSASNQANKRLSGRFFVLPIREPIENKVLDSVAEFSVQVWFVANRLAAYALLNLLDDPAMLAFAFS